MRSNVSYESNDSSCFSLEVKQNVILKHFNTINILFIFASEEDYSLLNNMGIINEINLLRTLSFQAFYYAFFPLTQFVLLSWGGLIINNNDWLNY
ncbi:MAG: hypothetical protein VYD71_01530 [Bacteroidota bacterium]|nr:hypothetical protein [Bacteroidota bacterium]